MYQGAAMVSQQLPQLVYHQMLMCYQDSSLLVLCAPELLVYTSDPALCLLL